MKCKIKLQAFLITTLILLTSGLGSSQKVSRSEEDNIDSITLCSTEGDLQFLIHVAELNMEEVLLGQLAQQRSKVPDVQVLGKKMEETHSQSFMDIKELAKKTNLTIPTMPNHKARWAYKKLKKKSENDFNIAYCELVIKEHRYAIAFFEKELKRSADEKITMWTRSMLPILQAHLALALDCQQKYENLFTGN